MRLRREALAVAAALALVLSGCTPTANPAVPDVQDFEFDTFHAQLILLRDGDGGSTLRTIETMTAIFPEEDQNRGIVRTIETYPSADLVGFEMIGVTDGAGTRRPFEIEQTQNVVTIVVAVPEGEFVHGEQTYEITYQRREVIDAYSEVQHFATDVNGVGWAQPFGTVTADLELVGDLATAVYNEPFCYVRTEWGDPDFECDVSGGEGFYQAVQTDLEPGETLHFYLEFQPGTFR